MLAGLGREAEVGGSPLNVTGLRTTLWIDCPLGCERSVM